MKLVACCPLSVGGAKLVPGDSFEASDYDGAKLISRGAARPATKPKSKKKAKAADAEEGT
jgi:hypothetical protein